MRRRNPSAGPRIVARNQRVGRRAVGPGHLAVAAEEPLGVRVAAHDEQRPVGHVDAPRPVVVDVGTRARPPASTVLVMSVNAPSRMYSSSAVNSRSTARPGSTGAASSARARRPAAGRADSALGQRQQAAQLPASDPLDELVGVGVLGDDGVGAVEQHPASPDIPASNVAAAASRSRLARPAGPARGGWRAPTTGRRWPARRAGGSPRPRRRARRRPPRRGRGRPGRGATPGSATTRATSATATRWAARWAARVRRGRPPSASAGGGTTGGRRRC